MTEGRKPDTNSRQMSTRGSVEDSAEPRFMTIGRVIKPHGVRGEVRVLPLTDLPKRFEWLESVFVGNETPRKIDVEGVRFHQDYILLKLAGVSTRDDADALRDHLLQVLEEDAIPLEAGEYFLYQAIGLEVLTVDGEYIGRVREILETGANNVFVIDGAAGEVLIPDIPDVIREVNIASGQLIISPLPGLLDSLNHPG